MSDSFALDAQNVSKNFAGTDALKDVSLSIPAGTTHVLLGSSGSGKSTLIRIILGLISPDNGQLFMNGRASTQVSHSEWSQSIGYVPEEGGLFPHLTARQNIALVATTMGWSQKRITDRIDELKDRTSLDLTLLNRYPKELSGGQRQRVALTRAAFLDPALLVLDEPLGALDPIIRADVQNELKTIFNALGKTVLMVTHDINEAQFFGHSLTLLKDGHVVQSGSFEDFLERPKDAFVTRFILAQRQGDFPK